MSLRYESIKTEVGVGWWMHEGMWSKVHQTETCSVQCFCWYSSWTKALVTYLERRSSEAWLSNEDPNIECKKCRIFILCYLWIVCVVFSLPWVTNLWRGTTQELVTWCEGLQPTTCLNIRSSVETLLGVWKLHLMLRSAACWEDMLSRLSRFHFVAVQCFAVHSLFNNAQERWFVWMNTSSMLVCLVDEPVVNKI